ncbi:hypothetical protein SAMN05444920_12668 [Nonomuraea solani]|uniref:Uncharacterized protein n=1 Tax=Nonomuraea solani TaxID=1144553 RepID=A0A1H6EWX2_9ACTN|nr:hypothetical protein [Nonomuraea solani]SEH02410.1 hypothetical protein SAMN05444920_12668 [Nonomuraea solani]
MNNAQRHPATGAPPAQVPAALQAITEQARQTWQRHLDDIVRRLGRGERLTAEQIFDTLRAQTVCTWWRLLVRHLEYADGGGLRPAQAVARFVSWITPYLDDPTPPESSRAAHAGGQDGELEPALAHLDHSLALIRQGAARTFLAQAETLVPASITKQSPSASAGQEATA